MTFMFGLTSLHWNYCFVVFTVFSLLRGVFSSSSESSTNSSGNIPEYELNALYDLGIATNIDNWSWKSSEFGEIWNFTSDANPCIENWQGITCNNVTEQSSPRTVIKLVLIHYNLKGSLPETISNLTSLLMFDLTSNHLSGGIPNSIGFGMTALEYIAISGNQLTGSIPSSFQYMTNLTEIVIAKNRIHGTIPDFFGDLKNLVFLNMFRNSLTGTIPASLGYIPKLGAIQFQYNQLEGSIPESFGQLSELYWLLLFSNHLTGTMPSQLCSLTKLLQITLRQNSFHGYIPDCVGNWTELIYLDLSANSLSGTLPNSLNKCTKLLGIEASLNRLTGPIPNDLQSLQLMQELYLYDNYMTGTIPGSLGVLQNLQFLYIQNNSFTGTIPTALAAASSLLVINIQGNLLSGIIPSVLGGMAELTEIFMQNNHFSGTLHGLFNASVHSNLSIIQVSQNQLSGEVPEEIFRLPGLKTFAAATNCFTGTLSREMCASEKISTLILDGLHSATACRIKNILGTQKTYFFGTIPSCLFQLPYLSTLHLSGNGLTGEISTPPVLTINLVNLTLSHNQLTGSIPLALQTHLWNNLDLSFNRMHGSLNAEFGRFLVISDNYTSTDYKLQNNRLSGKIPSHLVQAPHVSMLGSNMFSCALDKSDLPQHDNQKNSYECGSNSFNISFYVLLGMLFIIAVALTGVHWNDETGSLLYTALKNIKLNMRDWSEKITLAMPNIYAVCSADALLRRVSMLCTILTLLVLVPWYVVASQEYGTYTHQYAWEVSGAFLSGEIPAVVGLTLYISFLVLVIVASLRWLKHWNEEQTKDWRDSMTSGTVMSDKTQYTVSPSLQVSILGKAGIYVALVAVNLITVVGINAAFVIVTLTQRSSVLVAAQVFLSGFKLIWNTVCTPYLMRKTHILIMGTSKSLNDADFLTAQIVVALFNNIAIPVGVVALISPSCFYNVLFPADQISSTFSYKSTLLNVARGLFSLTGTVTDYVEFTPTFTYDYQCSSSVITYYAAAFVYLAIAAAVVSPLLRLVAVVILKKAHVDSKVRVLILSMLPTLWSPIDEISEKSTLNAFDGNAHLTTLITYFGILVTFGVMFPPLAVALCATIISVTWQDVLSLGRFLSQAQSLGSAELGNALERSCAGAVSVDKIRRGLFSVLCFACPFYGMFLFDTMGNSLGAPRSLWIFLIIALLPILAYLLSLVVAQYSRKGLNDELTLSAGDEQSLQMQNRNTNHSISAAADRCISSESVKFESESELDNCDNNMSQPDTLNVLHSSSLGHV